MSIKDLFDKGHSLKFLKNKSQDDLAKDLESAKYIDEYSTRRDRFFPDVDFATASNFARFGLAELYYENSIKRIYQTYPYDGSLTEKIEWENESTYLDLFMFENEYPRTNGHIIINGATSTYTATEESNIYSSSLPQYVLFHGGPHADASGDYKNDFSAGPSGPGVTKANIYDVGTQQTNNLELDPSKGVTVEFWMKKDGWASTTLRKQEYPFSLVSANGEHFYLRYHGLTATDRSRFYFRIESGSVSDTALLETGLSDIADGNWHHYTFTFKTYGSVNKVNFYVDGIHKETTTLTVGLVTGTFGGTLSASLGALAGPVGSSAAQGWGNVVSCSFDEFRYWKTERDAQQIGRYYRTQIGGGTNTDNDKYDNVTNKVDLGVYFKFNEGIVGNTSTDSAVLDYSGRISNGNFVNYSSECRSTGSAMVLSTAADYEFEDPIVYSDHPDVVSLLSNKMDVGSMHDHLNVASIYKSVPGWILEEDESESSHLKFLTQIIASYFDNLYLQMESLPRLKDINYPYDNNYEKPLPFADYLLGTRGLETPELFADASILAKYLQRGEKKLYEQKLYEVKNTIYQNIYNNLSYIQKSKGTIKSLRNFLRCYGIDEELIKINIYAANDTYELKENTSHASVKKKYLDFDDLETRFASTGLYDNSYTATAYQYYDSIDSNSISYIPGVSASFMSGASMTLEAEVIFPKRFLSGDDNYQLFPSLTSSIAGLHAAVADNEDLTYATDNTINFNFVVNKGNNDRRNASFALVSDGLLPILSTLETETFMGIYDNEKWNLAFRLRPTKHPIANLVDGSLEEASTAYTYEFYGVNYLSNILQNEFSLSGTMSLSDAEKFFTQPKRIYAGATRENFTGSVSRHSDVKVSSVKFWFDYLPNETIRAHGKDASIYGPLHPYKNSNFASSHTELFDDFIPQIETLALNWTLDSVTGSNPSGQFLIEDFASGSTSDRNISRHGWVSDVAKYNYTGRGDFFIGDSDYADQAVDVEFVHTAKQKLPEIINSDDFVKILTQQDEVVFTRDTTYIQHLVSIEKSMYQIISEEMLRFFATIVDFNNLIGDPVNRYRPNYKRMEKLRELFFEKVENEPDLDKFIEYYKWVDDAVTMMIAQLMPASSNSVELLRNMVESHVLERNKYWTKFPTLDSEVKDPISSLVGINKLLYNWKIGHAPLPSSPLSQTKNHLWWKDRAERDIAEISSSAPGVNDNKNLLLERVTTEIVTSGPTLKTIGNAKYEVSSYIPRRLAKPVHLDKELSLKLKGGSNPKYNNRHDYYKGVIKWGSDDDFIYLDLDNEILEQVIEDEITPNELNKKQFRVKALTMPANETMNSNALGAGLNDLKYSDAKSTLLLPFNIYSSSVDTGYQTLYSNQFKLDFTNIHDDKYGYNAEIPMQGPFAEKYVGGMQHRHIELNRGTDGQLTRAEGWHLQEFLDQTSTDILFTEDFGNATSVGTTDVKILDLPLGSTLGDPSPYEYWKNGVGADNSWTFLSGPTPSVGTGPDAGLDAGYAYCEVLPSKVGQTFALVTPLVDLLDVQPDARVVFAFYYHMYGLHIGNLKVQISGDPTFQTNVEDVPMLWDLLGSPFISTYIAGQQQTSPSDSFRYAFTASNFIVEYLNKYLGTRFYIRFLYTAGITHLGDCAIDRVSIQVNETGNQRNSFKLLNPTYDNHHRPSAIYTRQEFAKRPVNIRNIHMTGSSPTTAGNYLDRYEYVSTTSPEANDPWFIKHADEITSTTAEILGIGTGSIEEILTITPGTIRTELKRLDYNCLNKDYLTGSIKNRTRFKNRFSSLGGFEIMSRGFLDPAHETYSVYNAMPWRNNWGRKVYNTQLQAHMGQFGVSVHGPSTDFARVHGSETVGSINALDYTITGDASKHKVHRNNIERPYLVVSSSVPMVGDTAVSLNGIAQCYVIDDDPSLSFGNGVVDSPFSLSAWIKADLTSEFAIFSKGSDPTWEYTFYVSAGTDSLYFIVTSGGTSTEWVGQSTIASLNSHIWYHVCATYDGSSTTSGIKLYINGDLAPADPTTNGAYIAMSNTSEDLDIGKRDTDYSSGSIDEPSIWGVELSAAEVLELYQGADCYDTVVAGPGNLANHSQYNNLISWWRMGDLDDTLVGPDLMETFDRKGSNDATPPAGQRPKTTPGPTPGSCDIITAEFKSTYDNAFISHMIPRTDKQYAWITGSII